VLRLALDTVRSVACQATAVVGATWGSQVPFVDRPRRAIAASFGIDTYEIASGIMSSVTSSLGPHRLRRRLR